MVSSAAPGRAGAAVAADVAAGAAGAGIRVGEGDSGTGNDVVGAVGMQSLAGNSGAVRSRARMAFITAETVVGVAVGFRRPVRIGGRIGVAAAAAQCGRAPGDAGDGRLAARPGGAVTVAVECRAGHGSCGVRGGTSGNNAARVKENVLVGAGAMRVTLVALAAVKAVVGARSGMSHVRRHGFIWTSVSTGCCRRRVAMAGGAA